MNRHLSPLHRLSPLLALLLGTLPLASHAQSAYTLTELKSPTTYNTVATDMDNTGKVVGYTFDPIWGNGGFELPTLARYWRGRAVSWPTSTAASTTGSKGASYYVPMKINQVGVTAGFSTQTLTFQDSNGFMQPASEKAGKVTKLSNQSALNPGFNKITIGGINKLGVIAASGKFYNTEAMPSPDAMSAVLITPGQTLALEHPGHDVAFANGLNDLGTTVGSVIAKGQSARAAVWTNGKLSWVGQPHSEARAVNNAGQVLVRHTTLGILEYPEAPSRPEGADPKGAAAVWLGSQATPIGTDSQVVTPTSMNASGTVVGCVDGAPFIWKNGVMLDLVKEVSNKGAKLPAGSVAECPVAINDSGSILTSYRASPSSSTLTWVRINAKP
jgi:hypothetical protein